jgi:hypothetical protein
MKEKCMKRRSFLFVVTLFIMVFLMGAGVQLVADVVTVPLELAPGLPWCFPETPWGTPCPELENDYPAVTGVVEYNSCGNTFSGTITASGLIPNMQYQIKLEGIPICKDFTNGDDWSNVQIGYIGRWWNDTGGWNEPSDAAAEAAMAAGDCVLGYLLFDCATADSVGNLVKDFELDYSWHICGTPERGPVSMTEGDYKVNIILTEEGDPWRTALMGAEPVAFTVDYDDSDYDGVPDACDEETIVTVTVGGEPLCNYGWVHPYMPDGDWSGHAGQVTNDAGKAFFILDGLYKFKIWYGSGGFWSSVVETPGGEAAIEIPAPSTVNVTAGGIPLSGKMVIAYTSDWEWTGQCGWTDADGDAIFYLEPGQYKFVLNHEGSWYSSSELTAPGGYINIDIP